MAASHPPEQLQNRKVLFIGASGVGKSFVLNKLFGEPVAITLPSAQGCTVEVQRYIRTIDSHTHGVLINDAIAKQFLFKDMDGDEEWDEEKYQAETKHIRFELEIFDTMGFPDTEPERSVDFYNQVIDTVNQPWNLVIWVVPAGRVSGAADAVEKNVALLGEMKNLEAPLIMLVNGKEEEPMIPAELSRGKSAAAKAARKHYIMEHKTEVKNTMRGVAKVVREQTGLTPLMEVLSYNEEELAAIHVRAILEQLQDSWYLCRAADPPVPSCKELEDRLASLSEGVGLVEHERQERQKQLAHERRVIEQKQNLINAVEAKKGEKQWHGWWIFGSYYPKYDKDELDREKSALANERAEIEKKASTIESSILRLQNDKGEIESKLRVIHEKHSCLQRALGVAGRALGVIGR